MVDISAVINNQYPHFLYIRVSGEATQNETGSWVEDETTASYIGVCRDETGGRGSEAHVAQAVFRDYKSLIQAPVGTEHIAEGTEIFVTDEKIEADKLLNSDFVESAMLSGLVRITGIVSKFDNGRLHCRIWV